MDHCETFLDKNPVVGNNGGSGGPPPKILGNHLNNVPSETFLAISPLIIVQFKKFKNSLEAENFLHNLDILIFLGAKGTRSCIRFHVMGVPDVSITNTA